MNRRKLVVLLLTAVLLVVLFANRTCETVSPQEKIVEKRDYGHVEISDFDSLMLACQDSVFDWELLLAIAYVESKFDTTLVSEAGASGLMQIMPSTYKAMLVQMDEDTLQISTELNVRAAVRYLHELDGKFSFINPRERLNYILGSYNGGPGHVFDAMRIARRDGVNRFSWSNIVPILQSLSDSVTAANDTLCRAGGFNAFETIDYVKKVQRKYGEYRLMELMYQAAETLSDHITE